MIKRSMSMTIAALVLLGTTPVPIQAYDVHVEEIIRNPTVIYQKAFGVDTTPEIWNRVLDNLYLIGRLWGIYRFQPAYQVTRTDSGLHVVDPTGIIGDIQQVGRSDLFRCFYGRGEFNHWAVPSFFTADGVIMFECTTERNMTPGRGENLHAGKQLALNGRHEAFCRHPHPSHRQSFHEQHG
jgi:hypothetical protein